MKIVILPGLDGTGLLLRDFADSLRTEHDVQILSYPSTMSSYAEIGAWLSARLPANEFVIVAESFSGPMAIDIAVDKPDGLRAVIFVATFACAPRYVPGPLIRLMKVLPVPPLLLAWLSLPVSMGGMGTTEFRADYRRALCDIPRSTILGRLAEVLTTEKRDRLPKIAVPCSYLRAERDRLVPRSVSDDFAPHCAALISVDAPHFLLQARPAEAASHVSDIITTLAR